MDRLAIAFFGDRAGGGRVLRSLMRSRSRRYVSDAVVVARSRSGALSLHQTRDIPEPAIFAGILLGMVAGGFTGWLLWSPLAGIVIGLFAGALLGALWGMLADYGMEDDMIERLGSCLKPDTSALFLLLKPRTPSGFFERLQKAGAAVIRSDSGPRAEEAARRKLLALQSEGSFLHAG